MKPFDPTKPVQLRNGRKARIIATDRKGAGHHTIVALVENDNVETVWYFTKEGKFSANGDDIDFDLVNIPIKHKRKYWINVYPPTSLDGDVVHQSKQFADYAAGANRIACIEREIEFEEGEGL